MNTSEKVVHAPNALRRALLRLVLIVHLLPLAALTTGCEVFNEILTTGRMSVEEEIKFGERVEEEVEKDLTFVNDPIVVNYVRKIGNIVVANSPKQSRIPPSWYVVRDNEINAFAIPGGNIYVHTGLIDAADDEAELASVLAHELGHVIYRHGADNVARAMNASMLQQLILGQDAGEVSRLIGGLVAQGVLTDYSRQDELEADSIAVPTLYHAGYDPNGLISFFETLQERYGTGPGGPAVFFSTHPPTTERINQVRADIAALPPKDPLLRPINDLRKVQGRLRELGITEP